MYTLLATALADSDEAFTLRQRAGALYLTVKVAGGGRLRPWGFSALAECCSLVVVKPWCNCPTLHLGQLAKAPCRIV